MENKEILEQLYELQGLMEERADAYEKTEGGIAREFLPKFMELKERTGKPRGIPSVFSNWPYFPEKEIDLSAAELKMQNSKKYLTVSLGATAVLLIIFFLSYVYFFNTLSVIGIFASAWLGYTYSNDKKRYMKQKEELDKIKLKESEADSKFLNAFANLEKEKAEGMKAAEAYYEKATTAYEESTEILKEYGTQQEAAEVRFVEICQKIDEYTFMPQQCRHLVSEIIDLLSSGRADSYKEALNLAIREEREEEERAQRMEEEERRTALMERQAEEERRHYREMEAQQQEANRQQAAHNLAMEQAEKDRVKQEQKVAREASYQQAQAQSAANMRCARCANYNACGSARGQINCGAFRAKY